MIEATFLGTGTSQGVPVIGCPCAVCRSEDTRDRRLRTSLHVRYGGQSLVIDAGPDFRQQMLREGLNALDAILLTHEHNDHVAGMDDVRPFNFMQQRDMPVYGSEQVLGEIRHRFAYAFDANPYPGSPRFELKAIRPDRNFSVGGMEVIPILADHGGIPVLGFRFGQLVYITDAKTIAPKEMQKIRGARILVLNALRTKPHYSHLHLDAAIDLARDCGVGETWFTHISHDMGLHREMADRLPPGFGLAFDGQRLVCSA
jgi:phosphoribosyl 1,2-cyclic phosphate phosphodiesterase